jgi:hypothetical protein
VVTPWLAPIAVGAALLLSRHPMHTSVAEVRELEAGAVLEVAIRVFPDDLNAAVPGAGTAVADSALARYVRRAFSIADRSGRPVALLWKGAERVGDVLVLRLMGASPEGLAGASVSHGLLMEHFDDQINVVRAVYRGRTTTLVFVPGDAAKRLQ